MRSFPAGYGVSRRGFIAGLSATTLAGRAFAQGSTSLTTGAVFDTHVAGGPETRPLTTAFPQKGEMILQRVTPPWLETPPDVFDQGVFTPNDRFFVSWHWATLPPEIDVETFRLKIHGSVETPLSLGVNEILNDYERVELAAVCLCAGSGRSYFEPRVTGPQWGNGAMGNARWVGVRLRDVLEKAGIKAGAIQARFGGLDQALVPDAPPFIGTLDLDHAMDGEVMIAFAMNGEQIPYLNGFPLRLIVPGWSSVYWIKMLNDIEILSEPDETYWTKSAYRVPDNPTHTVDAGMRTGFEVRKVTYLLPRSLVTNLADGAQVPSGTATELRGIAMGGNAGVKAVDYSLDGGKSWRPARLGADYGKYSFRGWSANVTFDTKGPAGVMLRCTNLDGVAQPMQRTWNPAGYMWSSVETRTLDVV